MAKKKKVVLHIVVDDYLGSETVNGMDDAKQGIYMRLMLNMKKNVDSGIKADDDEVCRIVKCTRENFEYIKLHALFEENGRYYQKRLKKDHEDEDKK